MTEKRKSKQEQKLLSLNLVILTKEETQTKLWLLFNVTNGIVNELRSNSFKH